MTIFPSIQRNYIRILFPTTVVLLCCSLLYIYSLEPLPQGTDLCEVFHAERNPNNRNRNASRQWWEWACLIEQEWDKGNEYQCQNTKMMGNYRICFDEPYKPQPPCLVYSFGIDNDFRFDDAMADYGCEVFSFDPSMGKEDHQRSERVRFLSLGIATSDNDNFQPIMDGYTTNKKQIWKIRTLPSIKKMLGHENRPIDVLKMDVETYEWAIMKELVKNGTLHSVRQLTLEWHIFANEPMRTEFGNMFGTYMDLKQIGFRQFFMSHWSRHHSRYYFNSQEDSAYVNTMFKMKDMP